MKIKLMLDSGAFSAWKRGIEIDIHEYIAFIKKNQHLLHSYVNLDVIPGKPNRPATQKEVDEAAKASHRNLHIMRKAGLDPMPVFHYGEDFKWLRLLIEEKESYIGIGGLVGTATGKQIAWLDQVFTMLTDREGKPIVDTHGFGIQTYDLLKRYPWTTCDATSWALGAAFGNIIVPAFKGDQPDYWQTPIKLTVSEVDRKKGEMPNDHILRLGPLAKKRVTDWLEKVVGVTAAEVASEYEARARVIVFTLLQFQDAIGDHPFRHRLRSSLI